MKAILSVLIVAVLCIAVVGFFRGWFSVSGNSRDVEPNTISLTVDSEKVKDDVATVKDKTTELSGRVKEEAQDLADQARDNTKPSGE